MQSGLNSVKGGNTTTIGPFNMRNTSYPHHITRPAVMHSEAKAKGIKKISVDGRNVASSSVSTAANYKRKP